MSHPNHHRTSRHLATLLVASAILLQANLSIAKWTRVVKLNQPATSGFFFDDSTGIVGCGTNNGPGSSCSIYRTTDGGSSWRPCTIPTTFGRISDIFMRDRRTGYAAIMYSDVQLWETTDSGKTWHDFANNATWPSGSATAVYQTSKALIQTAWRGTAGFMPNTSTNWTNLFYLGNFDARSNGIAFRDDNTGIVTCGPGGDRSYITHDGGLTWSQGAMLNESWGIYADPTSGYFYTLPEGDASDPTSDVYRSTNDGATWQQLMTTGINNTMLFSGHIAGVGQTLYVQTITTLGLLRSDNGGYNWKMVGGPSNGRDTRFCVTGCEGAVVYAFDEDGGIWKTTDGGDGTLPAYIPRVIASMTDASLVTNPNDTIAAPLTLEAGSYLPQRDTLRIAWLANTDVLTPIDFIPTYPNITLDSFWVNHDTIEATFIVDSATRLLTDTTIGMLRFRTAVSDSLQSTVQLSSVAHSTISVCGTQAIAGGNLTVKIQSCGDSLLMRAMRQAPLLTITQFGPNPSSGTLHIEVYSPSPNPINYTIFDTQGRAVESGTLNPSGDITLRQLPSGSYTIQLTTANATTSRNFILQR